MSEVVEVEDQIMLLSSSDSRLSSCTTAFFIPGSSSFDNGALKQKDFTIVLDIHGQTVTLRGSHQDAPPKTKQGPNIILVHTLFLSIFQLTEAELFQAKYIILPSHPSPAPAPQEVTLHFSFSYYYSLWFEGKGSSDFSQFSSDPTQIQQSLIGSTLRRQLRREFRLLRSGSLVPLLVQTSFIVFRVETSPDQEHVILSPDTEISLSFQPPVTTSTELSLSHRASCSTLEFSSPAWQGILASLTLLEKPETRNLAPRVLSVFGPSGAGKTRLLEDVSERFLATSRLPVSTESQPPTTVLWLDAAGLTDEKLSQAAAKASISTGSPWMAAFHFISALSTPRGASLTSVPSSSSSLSSSESSLDASLLSGDLRVLIIIDHYEHLLRIFQESSPDGEEEEEESSQGEIDGTSSMLLHLLNNAAPRGLKELLYQLAELFRGMGERNVQVISGSSLSANRAFPLNLKPDVQYTLPKPSARDRQKIFLDYLTELTGEEGKGLGGRKVELLPIGQEDRASSLTLWAQNLALLTKGYRPGQMVEALERILSLLEVEQFRENLSSLQSQDGVFLLQLSWERVSRILASLSISSLQGVTEAPLQEDGTTSLGWGDFVGYHEPISALRRFLKPLLLAGQRELDTLAQPQIHGDTAAVAGCTSDALSQSLSSRMPKGMVIHGPSGCGKTFLAKIIAAQLKMNFIIVNSSDLLSKYFGQTEAKIRKYFRRALAASPCVLFFDDFDSIAHKRSLGSGSGDSSHGSLSNRVLSTFLNALDGVEGSTPGSLFVIAACLDVNSLDEALIRPGRLHHHVHLTLPSHTELLTLIEREFSSCPIEDGLPLSQLASLLCKERMSSSEALSFLQKVKSVSAKALIQGQSEGVLTSVSPVLSLAHLQQSVRLHFPHYSEDEVIRRLSPEPETPAVPLPAFSFSATSTFSF